MCVCVCKCLCVHVHVCMHMYLHACMCVCTCILACVLHACVSTCMRVAIQPSHLVVEMIDTIVTAFSSSQEHSSNEFLPRWNLTFAPSRPAPPTRDKACPSHLIDTRTFNSCSVLCHALPRVTIARKSRLPSLVTKFASFLPLCGFSRGV